MKQKWIFLAALLFAFGIHAALVEYSYTGEEIHTGAGKKVTYTYSGIMIYDTVSSNVTFVDWRNNKTYNVSTSTNLHFTTITRPASKTSTVITDSSSGTDTNGFYHLNDYMIRGENDTLPIAAGTTFVFPKNFVGSNNRNISPDDSGNEWLETWDETMTFSAKRTKSDNDKNSHVSKLISIFRGK